MITKRCLPGGLARGTLKLSHTFGYESAPAQYFSFAQPPPQSGQAWERKSTIALAANLVILHLLVDSLDVGRLLAQAIAIVLVTPANFVGNKLWSFRSNR